MLIYKITNDVNDKIYIGQTTKTLEDRILTHRNSYVCNCDTYLYNAMHKYGWEKFHFEVIDESPTTQEELDQLEAYYIEKYDSIKNGYNMIGGGSGANPMFFERSRIKHDNIMRSDEVRSKISVSMKESYEKRGGPTEEHRKHLSEQKKALYASPKGDLVRAKFRESYVFTPEHQAAMIKGRQKGVYCIDRSGNIIREFNTVKEAAQWWLVNGYAVKSYDQLCDRIKQSFVKDEYIKGLKWVYKDKQAGYRA